MSSSPSNGPAKGRARSTRAHEHASVVHSAVQRAPPRRPPRTGARRCNSLVHRGDTRRSSDRSRRSRGPGRAAVTTHALAAC
jgi:hypothetical protein